MTRFLPLLVGVAAVVASAFDSGKQTDRWGPSGDVKAASERVAHVKESFGDWQSVSQELTARQRKIAGVAGYISRLYTNRTTRAQFSVLLICGRPGPISVHTPEACYGAAGYERSGASSKVKVGEDEFSAAKFIKGPPQPDALRILWSWNTGDGPWQSPDNPRSAYGRGHGGLYKLYVIRQAEASDADATEDPAAGFLREFLPEVKRCLASNP